MNRIIPVILLVMMAYLTPLPPVGGCELHGPGCAHGSSCPTAQRQLAEAAAESCHTSNGHATETKRYRCSISSCHADTSAGLAALDVNFVVNLEKTAIFHVSSATFRQDSVIRQDPSFSDPSEPPEGLLIS